MDSHSDHRLAMSLAIAGLVADGETIIEGAECIADSFPGFEEALRPSTERVGSSPKGAAERCPLVINGQTGWWA